MGHFVPPVGVIVALGVSGALASAILPTVLYRYVEPRGRLHWARLGDAPATRRAPVLVRVTAWFSFVVGELALACLLVPVACGALIYLQAKVRVAGPSGYFIPAAALLSAAIQIVASVRLIPFGIRLLVRDQSVCAGAGATARRYAQVSAAVLFVALALAASMTATPGLVERWLRAALRWTALWPLEAYAALGLGHAILLWQCARGLRAAGRPRELHDPR